MQKPNAIWLAVLLVAGTTWAGEAPAPMGDLARVVSEDAFLFAELADPKGLWADFEQSGLRDMLRVVPPLDNQLKAATMMVPQVASQIFGTPWDELVTKYVTRVGLVMTDIPGQGGPDEGAPCFLLDASTTQAALDKLIRERAGAFLAKQNPGFAFVEETHRQVTLRIAKVNPQGVAYAFVDGVLVLGNPPSVKKLIDARAQRPLLANATFQKVRQIRLLTALTTGSSSAALVLPKECPILLALTFLSSERASPDPKPSRPRSTASSAPSPSWGRASNARPRRTATPRSTSSSSLAARVGPPTHWTDPAANLFAAWFVGDTRPRLVPGCGGPEAGAAGTARCAAAQGG